MQESALVPRFWSDSSSETSETLKTHVVLFITQRWPTHAVPGHIGGTLPCDLPETVENC